MKKRIIAAVLMIVMLLGVLPLAASAVPVSALQQAIDSSRLLGKNRLDLSYNTTVDHTTNVPAGFTLVIMPGVKLTLNGVLTVKGTLNNFGTITDTAKVSTQPGGVFNNPSPFDMYAYYGLFYSCFGYYPTGVGYQYPWQGSVVNPPVFMPDGTDNYYWYLYLLQNGYLDQGGWNNYTNPYLYYFSVAEPKASVASGSTVDFNSKVSLSTTTSGASIYYTTDGSTPDKNSMLYSGPIAINKTNMVIKAITVKSGYTSSQVSTFSYKTRASVSFTDLGVYADTLLPSLITLVQTKVIPDSTTLNPDGSISYDELMSWFSAIGVRTARAIIKDELITDKDALSNEDFAYITYRVLLNAPGVLTTPRHSSKEVLGKLKYGKDVTVTPSMIRAGVMSLVEAELFYRNDFYPKAYATRAYAFYMLAEVYNAIN